MCDYLGKICKGRSGLSTKYGLSCSYQKCLSRASAADNPSNYAWIAKENFSARATTAESGGLQTVREQQRRIPANSD